jgi:hypothetical protein
MELESIVILLFTLLRVEKMIGSQEILRILDGSYVMIMKYLICDKLHRKLNGLEEFVNNDQVV